MKTEQLEFEIDIYQYRFMDFDKENNLLDIFTEFNWSGNSKEEYTEKENFLSDIKVDTDIYTINVQYDVSGFDYWAIQMEEENYSVITVKFKVLKLNNDQLTDLNKLLSTLLKNIEHSLCDISEKYNNY